MAKRPDVRSQTPQYEPVNAEVAKRLVGRPPTYDPSYCQVVIERMLMGYSFGGFAGYIGIARSTVDDWRNRYPEFAAACARASAARLHWWEGKAIDIATTGGAGGNQGQMVIFGLINSGREDWKNKQEIEVSGQITLASIVEQTMKQVEARVIDHEPRQVDNEPDKDWF